MNILKKIRGKRLGAGISIHLIFAILFCTVGLTLDSLALENGAFSTHDTIVQEQGYSAVQAQQHGSFPLIESLFEEEIEDELHSATFQLTTILLSTFHFPVESSDTSEISDSSTFTPQVWGKHLYIAFHNLKIPSRI